MPSIHQLLRQAASRLASAGVPDAETDAGWLLAHVLGVSRLQALARGAEAVTPRQREAFETLLARRLKREPLQYILGQTQFMGLTIKCRPPVLIVRNDTETLAEQALARLPAGGRALDLCCGSGAIAVSLKAGCPQARVAASDISPHALALTRENAALHGLALDIRQGDLFIPWQGERFQMICCNPPYIASGELPHLQPEVGFEPPLALDGGPDGLKFYKSLFCQAGQHLLPGGWLLLEVGDGQMQAVKDMAQVEFDSISVYDDMGGLPRVLAARRKGTDGVAG